MTRTLIGWRLRRSEAAYNRLSHDPSESTWSTGSFGAVLLPHLTRHTSSAPVPAMARHSWAPTNSRSPSSSTPGPNGPPWRASSRASVCSPLAYLDQRGCARHVPPGPAAPAPPCLLRPAQPLHQAAHHFLVGRMAVQRQRQHEVDDHAGG